MRRKVSARVTLFALADLWVSDIEITTPAIGNATAGCAPGPPGESSAAIWRQFSLLSIADHLCDQSGDHLSYP